jgi:uncharacterized protein YdeI (YjbR/CyaY-like superfamily)
MGSRDPRIDAYIERAAPFAQPILRHFRDVVHEGCPDVEETLKWSMPAFVHEGLLAAMAAFKQHCAIHFWKASLVLGDAVQRDSMGSFGRVTNIKDLPPRRTLLGYVKKAAALNDHGITASRPTARKPAAPVRVPPDLGAALKSNAKAKQTFDAFAPSHRREYIEWITGAKRDETRKRRVEAAVRMMAEGKSQNWKYER